jgi:hypothetical protein
MNLGLTPEPLRHSAGLDWTCGRRLRGFQKGGKESFPMPTAWPVGERALGFGQRTGLFGDPVLD